MNDILFISHELTFNENLTKFKRPDKIAPINRGVEESLTYAKHTFSYLQSDGCMNGCYFNVTADQLKNAEIGSKIPLFSFSNDNKLFLYVVERVL